jgi:hypothetical protein
MAAKRKIAPPKPRADRTWTELTSAEQSAAYARALHAYAHGEGPNPQTLGVYSRSRTAEEARA